MGKLRLSEPLWRSDTEGWVWLLLFLPYADLQFTMVLLPQPQKLTGITKFSACVRLSVCTCWGAQIRGGSVCFFIWRPEIEVRCLSGSVPTWFRETGSQTELRACCPTSSVSHLVPGSGLNLLNPGITSGHYICQLFMWALWI